MQANACVADPGALPSRKSSLPTGRALKRAALGLALGSALGTAVDYGYRYWTAGRYLQSTDDAYVKADSTTVAPKVSGYIADVLVQDNETVGVGQVLARIDDRDLKAALDQAQADVAAADAAVRNLDAQIVLQGSVIDQQQAAVAATEATLTFAREDHARYQDLRKSGAGTVQRAQQAETALRETTSELQRDQAALIAARAKVDVLIPANG
jgi:membrane fusion protein, multidrug efflux system